MEIEKKTIMLRGKAVEVAIPGHGAGDLEQLASFMEAFMLSLLALEDPRVDAILDAYDIRADNFFEPPREMDEQKT